MPNSIVYSLPALMFILLFYKALNKKTVIYDVNNQRIICRNVLGAYIIGIYLLSASLIYFVREEEWYPYFHSSSYTTTNFILYGVVISIYLLPAIFVRPLYSIDLLPRGKSFTILLISMTIAGLFSIAYQIPYAITGLAIGALQLRQDMNAEKVFLLPVSPLTTLAVGISSFYLFYLVFFFIALIQKRSWILIAGLFISSFSNVISGMTFATRDAFVFYILGIIFVYVYLGNCMPLALKNKVILAISAIIIVGAGFLLSISIQRFNSGSGNDFAWGTIGYISPQPFVFSETVSEQTNYYDGNLRFPVFKTILTLSEVPKVERTNNYETMFGTFIKDLYAEGGYLFLAFFTILFVPFFILKFKYSNDNNFYRRLILLMLYFQFMSTGLFYLVLGSRSGNMYILILFLFYNVTFFGKRNRRAR